MNYFSNPKYKRRFTLGMIAYTISIFVWVYIVVTLGASIWSYLATLLPLAPAAFAMYNVFLGIREQDELEQKIQLESVFITLVVISNFAFTYGLLEYASLVPKMPTFLIAPGAIGVWGIASGIIRKRYA